MEEALPKQPARWRSLNSTLKPALFQAFVESHPARQRLRWFRAWSEPDFDFDVGEFSTPALAGVHREEVVKAREYWAVVDTADRFAKKMGMVGQIPVGQLMCITMRDQLPLADGDEIVLLGQTITEGVPDGLTRPMKRTLVRGATQDVRSGTISSVGADVVGVGTTFLTDLTAGSSIVRVLGMRAVVKEIHSDTHLTLATALSQDVSGNEWERCEDALPEWPAVRINGIRMRSGFVSPDSYSISPYGDRLIWSGADAPGIGERYSIIYDYLPRYIVREFRGYSVPPTVEGQALPQMVMLDTAVGSAPS